MSRCMSFRRLGCMSGVLAYTLTFGCDARFPLNTADLVQPIDNAAEQLTSAISEALADPLQNNAFPILVGGNNAEVFYVTNLTDSRIRFPGPAGDVILPGILGPANLYRYDIRDRERRLIRPLVFTPANEFARVVTTDGDYVAYVYLIDDLDTDDSTVFEEAAVAAGTLSVANDQIIFDPGAGDIILGSANLAVANGRLAYVVTNTVTEESELRVVDLTGAETNRTWTGTAFGEFTLNGDRLAYVARDGNATELILRDLSRDDEIVYSKSLRNADPLESSVYLTDNLLVWSEPDANNTTVMAYDVPSGESFVWESGLIGRLAGATDDHFVMEEYEFRFPDANNRFSVRRYDRDGSSRRLARFPDEGLAGQTSVFGDQITWVNDERRVLVQPAGGGDRLSLRPF